MNDMTLMDNTVDTQNIKIAAKDVNVYYGDTHAIKDVNVEIEDNTVTAFIGPSGCGKSTLLNCIAGLEPISGGRIEIGGRDMTHVSPKDRDIAMVFQNYALYPHMTVRDNIGFALKLAKTPKLRLGSAAR